MEIISMTPEHWDQVKDIYEQGILTGNATFQTSTPSWIEWDESHLPKARLVAVINDKVAGWAALSPVSGRCVYAGVAEVSVYVGDKVRGKGVGKRLLSNLVEASEREGFWTLQAGVFPENAGSLKIHELCGFRIIGVREKIGLMNGVWRDTVLLERRSATVGISI